MILCSRDTARARRPALLNPKEPLVPMTDLVTTARSLRSLIEAEADEIESTCTLTKPVVDAVEQAALSFGLWTGQVPDSGAVLKQLRAAAG